MKVILLILIIGGVVGFVFYAPKIFKNFDLKKGINATSTASFERKISSANPVATIKPAGYVSSQVKSGGKTAHC